MDTAIADHLVLPLGQDLGIADDHGPGRTFLKAPSAHGTQTMTPRDGDTFIAERGAILSGAIVLPLGDFHRMKVCTSSTAKHSRTRRQWIGDVEAGTKGNRRTTTTSRKFTILRSSSPTETARHVNTLEDVNQPGTRFFDYEADRIGMYDDPASCDQVERSVGEYAFAGAGTTDVTLGDLTVPRYANRAQNGAISGAGVATGPCASWSRLTTMGRASHLATGYTRTSPSLSSTGKFGIIGNDGMLVESNNPPIIASSASSRVGRQAA